MWNWGLRVACRCHWSWLTVMIERFLVILNFESMDAIAWVSISCLWIRQQKFCSCCLFRFWHPFSRHSFLLLFREFNLSTDTWIILAELCFVSGGRWGWIQFIKKYEDLTKDKGRERINFVIALKEFTESSKRSKIWPRKFSTIRFWNFDFEKIRF